VIGAAQSSTNISKAHRKRKSCFAPPATVGAYIKYSHYSGCPPEAVAAATPTAVQAAAVVAQLLPVPDAVK